MNALNRVFFITLIGFCSLVGIHATTGVAYAATNLITNPSLENSSGANPTSWSHGNWGSLTSTFTYPVAGRTGGSAAQVAIQNYVDGDAKWFFADVTVAPGSSYTFTNYSLSNNNTEVTARFRKQNGGYSYLFLGTVQGTGTWTKFEKTITIPAGVVSMTVFHILSENGTLTVDDYSLVSPTSGNPNSFAQGMVTFSFDDGFKNVYDVGLPILEAAGIKSTQAIITKSFGDPGYVNATEVVDMKNRGHEIVSHTRTHPHLTTLGKNKLNTELKGSRNDLIALGISPVNTLVYPYGEYNTAVINAAKAAGYTGARGVVTGYNTPTTNRWDLHDQHVTSGVSFATIRGWIDYAVANKVWLILELHQQSTVGGEYSNDPAVLQQVVDYIASKNIKTVTLGEGIGLLTE